MLSDSTRKKIPEPVKKIYRLVYRYTQTSKNILFYPFRYKYGYNRGYYLIGDIPERKSYKMRIIRPGDMGAALAYAFGVKTYSDVVRIFEIDTSIQHYLPKNTSCREQADQLVECQTRKPNLVLDVGCGRGEVSATLTHMGIMCIPIDPARGAASLIEETFREYYDLPPPHEFINKPVLDALRELRKTGLTPDTIIFCESIEHIPHKEFFTAFEIIKNMLTVTSGLMIITNWIHFHPICHSNADWNHTTTIDETVYDSLAAQAKSIVFRQGSHLVLQF